MLNQFSNISCYEEFEIQCALAGISKVDVLKEVGHKIYYNYYFFISNDGIFNWYDLKGNHIEEPCILKAIEQKYIPKNIVKCVIPNSVTNIGNSAFWFCESLKEITIPDNVTSIGDFVFSCCTSLTSITIPNSVIDIGYNVFHKCTSLNEVIFKGKTLDEVKQMENYPFGITNESIIKYDLMDI